MLKAKPQVLLVFVSGSIVCLFFFWVFFGLGSFLEKTLVRSKDLKKKKKKEKIELPLTPPFN